MDLGKYPPKKAFSQQEEDFAIKAKFMCPWEFHHEFHFLLHLLTLSNS